jgi:GTP-binding protein Era
MSDHRFGYVALVGRPNVGKSTLLNQLVGEPVAIVTHKPQTTRHLIRGWITKPEGQVVFVDTPGIHTRRPHALNQRLNRMAYGSLSEVDVIVWVVDALKKTPDDEAIIGRLKQLPDVPKILAFNKIDQLKDRSELLKQTQALSTECLFEAVVYLSARTGNGVNDLLDEIYKLLPQGEAQYSSDEYTDRSMRFLVAERIREQLMLQLHQELPYGLSVVIERYEEKASSVVIHALIVVAEDRHKGMVIGQKGQVLKRVGSMARREIENLVGCSVHLTLHVKTRSGWMDDESALDQLGYDT